MTDDLVINVRQIGNYPFRTDPAGHYWVSQHDLVLVQKDGAAGNPYASTCCVTLVGTAGAKMDVEFPFGWGEVPPLDAGPPQMFTGNVVLPEDASICWNGYATSGYHDNWVGWNGGTPAAIMFHEAGGMRFTFGDGPTPAGQPFAWNLRAELLPTGYLTLADTLAVARDPAIDGEVATKHYVDTSIAFFQNEIDHLFDGDIHILGALTVEGLVTFTHHLNVTCGIDLAGSETITGNLQVGGNSSIDGNVLIGGEAVIGGMLTAQCASLGDMAVNGDANITGQMEVGDRALFDGGIYVAGEASICGNATISCGLSLSGNLCVNGYGGFAGDVGVLGDLDVLQNLGVNGIASAQSPPLKAHNGELVTASWVRHHLCEETSDLRRDLAGYVDFTKLQILWEVNGIYAPIHSPDFTGMPTGPTAAPGSNDAKLATTAYVDAATAAATVGVSSFNTRTGHVVLGLSDVTAAGGAPNHSPHLTGQPEADTAPPGTATRIIASTEFVHEAIEESRRTSVVSFNQRVGHVVLSLKDIEDAGGAPVANPTFIGGAHSVTPDPESHDTNVATTEFVYRAVYDEDAEIQKSLAWLKHNYARHTVWRFNQRSGNVTLRGSDISAAGGALLDSPHFVGYPTAPTAPPQTATNQIATTKYVDAAIASNPGPPGIQGPMGNPGPPGQGFKIVGSVETFSELPTEGVQINDVWFVEDSGDGWVWDGTRWKSIGHIRGARGYQGEQGPQGEIGPTGANVHVQTTAPLNPETGWLWIDPSLSDFQALRYWSGTNWVYAPFGVPDEAGYWAWNGQGGGWVNLLAGPPGVTLPYLPLVGGTLTGGLTVSSGAVSIANDLSVGGTVTLNSDVYAWTINFGVNNITAQQSVITFNCNISNELNCVRGVFNDVRLISLPTTDPLEAGRLWNDNGTLKVSAG